MKSQYFLAGNLWSIVGVLAIAGRKFERSEPTMYSLFGAGRAFHPGEYATLVGWFSLRLSPASSFTSWPRGHDPDQAFRLPKPARRTLTPCLHGGQDGFVVAPTPGPATGRSSGDIAPMDTAKAPRSSRVI